MSEPTLTERLAALRRVIAERQAQGGWTHAVRIVAVTKGHDATAVRAAAAAGLDTVGENRVQEALAKQDATAGLPVEWHLIGTLQRNKVRQIVGRFALIHSVDRVDLAQELQHRVPAGARQAVLVQVNCSAEAQKGGVEPGELPALLDELRAFTSLDVRGLMTMAEFTEDERVQRRTFALLRTLQEAARQNGHALPELSIGMSGDFGAAVEEGATMVRLGTALFGERQTKP
ncbi:MAG TPA: YggS family pyridoxal phosphate-dependent enzyme [Gemmatimonadales bacterium]|jgi:hypothetical protein|nr:YggS family pyridoxal phosphate-dependent enzyme [Gemmatimonadales bacterium]